MKDQRRVVRNEQRQRPIVQDGFDLDVIARQDMQALHLVSPWERGNLVIEFG